MDFHTLIFILEMIGSVAFAISGVVVAKDRKMDIFGACLLGCTTACGGGLIRDLILGQIPPQLFLHPVYVTVAFVTSVIFFIVEITAGKHFSNTSGISREKADALLNAADSVGLAAFVAVGYQAALECGYDNGFLCVFVGVLTGIGGGILRDMMAGQMPLIMRKRVYGVAAIAGGITYYAAFRLGATLILAAVISMIVTVMIRFLAIHYRWNLPAFRD